MDVVQGRDHDAAAHLAWDGSRFQDLTSGRYLTATDPAFGGFTPPHHVGLDVARANQGRRPASQMQVQEGPGAFDDGLYEILYERRGDNYEAFVTLGGVVNVYRRIV